MTRCRLTVKRFISKQTVATFDLFRDGTTSFITDHRMILELLSNDFAEHVGFPAEFIQVKKENEQAHIMAICYYLAVNLGFDVDVSYPAPEELPIGGNF